MFCLQLVCPPCVCLFMQMRKEHRIPQTWDLQLGVVVSHCLGAGNRTQVLYNSNKWSELLASLAPYRFLITNCLCFSLKLHKPGLHCLFLSFLLQCRVPFLTRSSKVLHSPLTKALKATLAFSQHPTPSINFCPGFIQLL